MDENARSVVIDSDVSTRKGVFSNFAMISTTGGVSRVDFLLTDIDSEGSSRAVLSTRVFMGSRDLLSLRDAIDAHLESLVAQNAD